jgi:hypothetical protein
VSFYLGDLVHHAIETRIDHQIHHGFGVWLSTLLVEDGVEC